MQCKTNEDVVLLIAKGYSCVYTTVFHFSMLHLTVPINVVMLSCWRSSTSVTAVLATEVVVVGAVLTPEQTIERI